MKIKSKLEALNRVFEIYDGFSSNLDLACKEKCAHCCTTNVTMTTLEGYKIVSDLIASGKADVIDNLKEIEEMPRFQPLLTTNRVAELCAAFLCHESGIGRETRENNAAYLDGWRRALKSDARCIVTAASQAQKAADWILGRRATTECGGGE